MRLFIAINFPGEIKAAIAKIRDSLKGAAFRGNFSANENLHLTLAFLGECDSRQTEAIKSVMDAITFPELTLMLDKAGYFKRDGGDTWWIGLKENKPLSDLQTDLSGRLRQKGFVLDDRKFRPHVTVGREVKMRSGFVRPEVPQVGFSITSMELMKSERINGKLIYAPVYSSYETRKQ